MIELLPKTRWAPMPGGYYKIPMSPEDEFKKSELEMVFDGAKVRYDVAEVGVLVYDSIEDLPDACKLEAWNYGCAYNPIASFPSLGAACWFLSHLESISVYQKMVYATQSDPKSEPQNEDLVLNIGWQVYNELREDGNWFVNNGHTPKEGWEKYCWWQRSYLAGQKTVIVSEGGQDDPMPEGTWVKPCETLRVAWGLRDEVYDDYVVDLNIFAIVEADDKAWLIGSCWMFPYWINLSGREGCIFESSYFDVAQGATRKECKIDTPFGAGTWYYLQFDLESKFKVDNWEVRMPTGAKDATMIFNFIT